MCTNNKVPHARSLFIYKDNNNTIQSNLFHLSHLTMKVGKVEKDIICQKQIIKYDMHVSCLFVISIIIIKDIDKYNTIKFISPFIHVIVSN